MKLIILERGNYFCFKDPEYDTDVWAYSCELLGNGWLGFKWAFTANHAEIRNRKKETVARITFFPRLFKPHILKIELFDNQKRIEINAIFLKKLAYYPFTFEMNDKLYRFEAYNGHNRALYENDIQVASFDKEMVAIFNRDTFVSLAENNMNVPLIFALSIFDDIWTSNRGSGFNIDFGNIGQGRPPDRNWKPG